MTLRFSARNQLRATVKSVKLGTVMAEVIVELADGRLPPGKPSPFIIPRLEK